MMKSRKKLVLEKVMVHLAVPLAIFAAMGVLGVLGTRIYSRGTPAFPIHRAHGAMIQMQGRAVKVSWFGRVSENSWFSLLDRGLLWDGMYSECFAPYGSQADVEHFQSAEAARRSFWEPDPAFIGSPPDWSCLRVEGAILPPTKESLPRDRERMLEVVSGVPFRMFYGMAIYEPAWTGGRTAGPVRSKSISVGTMPAGSMLVDMSVLRPLVWGIRPKQFALNAIVAIALWGVLYAIWKANSMIALRVRLRRGLCPRCTYPLCPIEGCLLCPECGWRQTITAS